MAFTAYNIADDPVARATLFTTTGRHATPVVVVGDEVVVGFDRGRLQRLLHLADRGRQP
jgi:hypothetical protein